MATFCSLCDKKMGIFDGFHTPADVLLCDNCYAMYENIIDSMNGAEEFQTKIAEFKAIFSNNEKVEILVEHLNSLYNSKLKDAEKKAAEKEQERLEELHLKEEEEKQEKEKQRRDLEQERLNRERIQQQYQIKIDNLNKIGLDGYYEYKAISLLDESGLFRKNSGKVDISAMTEKLNELGLEGWHLITAYSNELGKNALSGGAGGVTFGVNSTVDENILIFERFIKINK